MITEQQILDALKTVQDPDLHRDIVSLGFVRNIKINGDHIQFDINLTTPACPVKDQLKLEAESKVQSLEGVKQVSVNMTAEVRAQQSPDKKSIKGVKNIIAVASGKGGVGKSTVATNLAIAMSQSGAKVGLLDGDIYGPSIPFMMGREHQIDVDEKTNTVTPANAHGVKFMSMGFMAPGDKPLIWRGPMAHGALQQTLFQVDWGELDYLFVDLPPGTGDVHLTLVQSVQVAGAVLVTTPQDVGLTISLKTFRMFETTKVKMLGLIENMSFYECAHCGERDEIFGHGLARKAAEELKIPFLGAIPLQKIIREQGDKGVPITAGQPDHPISQIYRRVSELIAAQVSIASFQSPLSIVEEPATT